MAINTRNPVSSASIGGHPIHPILITLPIGFWVATLLADIGFWWTATDGWATAALWLLGAAIVAAALAAVAGRSTSWAMNGSVPSVKLGCMQSETCWQYWFRCSVSIGATTTALPECCRSA